MKNIVILSLIMLSSLNAVAGEALEKISTINGVIFHSAVERKLYLQLPIKLEFSLFDDVQMISFVTEWNSAEMRRALKADAKEVCEDCQIISLDHRTRVENAKVALPGGKEMSIKHSPSGEPYLEGTLTLTREAYAEMKSRLQSGEKPKVDILLSRKEPIMSVVKEVFVPTAKICRDLHERAAKDASANKVLAHLMTLSQSYMVQLEEVEHQEKLASTLIESCVRSMISKSRRKFIDLDKLEVSVNKRPSKQEYVHRESKVTLKTKVDQPVTSIEMAGAE